MVEHMVRKAVDPEFAANYALAERWKQTSLSDGRSLFDDSTVVWTEAAAADLHERFIERADLGDRSFNEKLEDQFRDAPQESCLLMAELMLIHLLPVKSVTLPTKLRNIDQIGALAPQPFATPDVFHDGLGTGIFSGGAGFNTRRWELVSFLIRFARRWTAADQDERDRALADPWAFKAFLQSLPLEGATSQLNALLLLLFPQTFEDISSRDHKKRIVEAFPDSVGESTDIDRQILAIRAAKEGDFGKDFSWYSPEARPVWDRQASPKSRTSTPKSVGDALEAIFPDDNDRSTFASVFAAAVIEANKVNPSSWSVSFRNGGVHLNVGPNRTLSVVPSELGLAGYAASSGDLEELIAPVPVSADEQPYTFPGEVTTYLRSNPADSTVVLETLEASLLEAVRRTAIRDGNYRRSHSAEAVDAIAFLSGQDLPAPITDRVSTGDVDSRRAWIVHVKRDGKRESAGAIERGDIKVFYDVNAVPGSTFEEVKGALRSHDPELSTNAVGTHGGNLHRFLTKMQPGDIVLLPDGSDLHLGYIDGEPAFQASPPEWTRQVNWLTADEPIARADVSPALYSRLRSLLTITDISELLPELRGLLGETGPDAEGNDTPLVPTGEAVLPAIDDDLAKTWMLDRAWLEELVGLLRRKRQVIFYGPPGTGKTYLAEKLAAHMTGGGGSYKLVQFHPSYSYEDFVEGFRPQVDGDGALTYELTPGPLKLLAEAAKADPSQPYFLLIDEINRGNLAKIFGELYYLLEYREQSLVLQYGGGAEDEFSLPKNLYVIGTMNTADRSIAMVDAAIRRRFYFVEFSPTKEPIASLLSAWCEKHGHSQDLAQLLDELNARLDDDDYAIGPSYLMNEDATTDAGLERVWTYGIMPLLVEHFYGQPGATERFELEALRRSIAPPNVAVEAEAYPTEEAEVSSVDSD